MEFEVVPVGGAGRGTPSEPEVGGKRAVTKAIRYVMWLVLLSIAFYCAAKVSRYFLIVESVSIFWVANGLGLLLLIISECTPWDALAGALAMTLVGNFFSSDLMNGDFAQLGVTAASCVQIVLAYNILMYWAPEVRNTSDATTTMRFCQALWLSIIVSCSVSGVIAVVALKLTADADAKIVFLTWFLGDAHAMFFMLYSCLSIREEVHHSLGTFTPNLFAVAQHMQQSIRQDTRCMEYSRHEWLGIAEFAICMMSLIGIALSLGQYQGFVASNIFESFRWTTSLALMYPLLGWVVIRFSRCRGVIIYVAFVAAVLGQFKARNSEATDIVLFVYATMEIFVVLDLAALGTSVMGIFYHEKRKMVLEKERLIAALQSAQAEANDAKLEAEARARDATLFSHMSHELKSPLNVILGFASLLKEKSLDVESQQHLSHIAEAGGLLLQLIVDLLDMLRSRAGKLEVRAQEVDIAECVTGLCYQIQELGRRRKVEVTWDVDREIPRALVDSGKIAQLVHNLGSNAIKFTPAGGKVKISLEREDPLGSRGSLEKAGSYLLLQPHPELGPVQQVCNVKLSVRDEGIGIPKEKMKSIFQDFERLESAFDATPGTGIGLAIVTELVRLLGGSMDVVSPTDPESSGSTFAINLPLSLCNETKPCSPSPSSRTSSHAALDRSSRVQAGPEHSSSSHFSDDHRISPLKVLVVEDERLNRRLLHRLLQNDGHTVVMACDGAEALQTASEAEEAFDIVLLDLFMPVMDGEVFMQNLKEKGRPKSIATAPIYITSADLRDSKWDALVELGISGRLDKPYMMKAFREVFRQVAINSSALDAPYSGNDENRYRAKTSL